MSDRTFGALILTHGRPDNVLTFKSLRRQGYTGPIYLVIDSEDETADQYRDKFGTDKVIVFDKNDIADTFDIGDSRQDHASVIYARNAAYKIAEDLGLDYFIELDDDYTSFMYRFPWKGKLGSKQIRYLDRIFDAMVDLLEDTGAMSVAMSQGGDHIGGIDGTNFYKGLTRKVMNSFVFRTDRPVEFVGRMNDDVNTYVTKGSRGDLFFTAMQIQLCQLATQSNEGGLTDMYIDAGTYVKSFYTVMMHPSSVKIGTMGNIHRRYHHMISWDHTVPKIISDKYRVRSSQR
jgi:hypothetical protein